MLTQPIRKGFDPSGVFWVSQSVSFRPEREGGFLFAPKSRKDGGPPVAHWSTMTRLTPSSLILCSAKKKLDFVAIPRSACKVVDSPEGLKDWPRPGWQCDVDYYRLDDPIRIYDEIPEGLRISEQPRFMKSNRYGVILSQQYLSELSPRFARALLLTFVERWPAVVRQMMSGDDISESKSAAEVRTRWGASVGPREIGNSDRPETINQARTGYVTIAELVHEPLIHDYRNWLGRPLEEWTYENGMRCDAFDSESGTLIEAKPRLTSSELQRAVGQLFIYRSLHRAMHGESSVQGLEILTDADPGSAVAELLDSIGIGLAFRRQSGFVRLHSNSQS